jgi:hypothetical protein
MRNNNIAYRVLVGNLKERDHHENIDVGEEKLLKRITEKDTGV